MPSTTTYKFGDVVLVAFPFTNLQATKKRPAVVISRQSYQQNRPDVILMAVTSRFREPLAEGEAVVSEWQAAGLAKPSVLKPLIATLEQTRVVRTLGRLSDGDQAVLHNVIHAVIGQQPIDG